MDTGHSKNQINLYLCHINALHTLLSEQEISFSKMAQKITARNFSVKDTSLDTSILSSFVLKAKTISIQRQNCRH